MKPEHKKYILENIKKKSISQIAQELNLKDRKIKKFLEKEKERKNETQLFLKAQPEAVKKWVAITTLALIAIIGFSLYYNSLDGEFIWDDRHLIQDNIFIKDWQHVGDIFTKDMGAGAGFRYGFYRPIQIFTYAIIYSFVELDTRLYHITSVVFHILAGLCIYWLITLLYGDRFLSFLATIFFIIHPIQTEAVAYISGFGDPIGTFFMLIAFIAYIKYLESKNMIKLLIVALCYLLAILSKESTIVFPALLLLYHYSFRKKVKIKEFLFISSIACSYVLLRLLLISPPRFHIANPTTLVQRIPGFFVAITTYFRLLIAPFRLHIDYGNKIFPYSNPKALLGMVIIVFLLLYLFKKRKTRDLIFFCIPWFFIPLLPVSNLYPINFYITEHWLYVPSIAVFLVLAKYLTSLYRKKHFKLVTVFLITCSLIFYSYLTFKRNEDWRKPIPFYEKTLMCAPDSFRILSDLGLMYHFDGRSKEGVPLLEKSIKVNSRYVQAYTNLALVYNALGKHEEAILLCKKALKIKPDNPDAYNNMGQAYHRLGKFEEAASIYEKAIKLNPKHSTAYSNLGIVYIRLEKLDKAVKFLKKSIELKPGFETAHYNLGNAYIAKKMPKEAMESFKKAIEIKPDYAKAHNNLAAAYYHNTKHYDLAVKHCDIALGLGYKVHPKFLESLEEYR